MHHIYIQTLYLLPTNREKVLSACQLILTEVSSHRSEHEYDTDQFSSIVLEKFK